MASSIKTASDKNASVLLRILTLIVNAIDNMDKLDKLIADISNKAVLYSSKFRFQQISNSIIAELGLLLAVSSNILTLQQFVDIVTTVFTLLNDEKSATFQSRLAIGDSNSRVRIAQYKYEFVLPLARHNILLPHFPSARFDIAANSP